MDATAAMALDTALVAALARGDSPDLGGRHLQASSPARFGPPTPPTPGMPALPPLAGYSAAQRQQQQQQPLSGTTSALSHAMSTVSLDETDAFRPMSAGTKRPRPPENSSFRTDKMDAPPYEVPRAQAELSPGEYHAMRAARGGEDLLHTPGGNSGATPPSGRPHGTSPPFFDGLITGKPASAEMQNFDFEKITGMGGDTLADLARFGSSMSGNELFRDASGGTLLLPHFSSNGLGQLGEPAVNWVNPGSLPSLSDPSLPFLGGPIWAPRAPLSNSNLSNSLFAPASALRMSGGLSDPMPGDIFVPTMPSNLSARDERLLSDLPNRFQNSQASSRSSLLQMQASFYQSGHLPASMLKHSSSRNSSQVSFTVAEEQLLLAAVQEIGTSDWDAVALRVPGRTAADCSKVWNSRLNPGIKRGQWTREEDAALLALVESAQAQGKTIFDLEPAILQQHVPGRTVKQVRERWRSNLDPSIVRGTWKAEEDAAILKMRDVDGLGWAAIARALPGRTEHSVKTRHRSMQRAEKRAWSSKEDARLLELVTMLGTDWEAVASHLTCRTPHLARERYGVLRPGADLG